MKSLTLFFLALIAAGGAQAQERAYTLDGTAIELRGDGTSPMTIRPESLFSA